MGRHKTTVVDWTECNMCTHKSEMFLVQKQDAPYKCLVMIPGVQLRGSHVEGPRLRVTVVEVRVHR